MPTGNQSWSRARLLRYARPWLIGGELLALQSLNLVFHLVSALVLIVLVWALLRQQKTQSFERKLWLSLDSTQKTVYVDWPHSFFRALGSAWGIKVSWDSSVLAQPTRIDLRTFVLCHVELGFIAVELIEPKSLRLLVRQEDGEGLWGKRLEEALSHHFRIELALSS